MKRLALLLLSAYCLAGMAGAQPKPPTTTVDLLDAHITAGHVQGQLGGKFVLSGGVTIHIFTTPKNPKDVTSTVDLTADKITITTQKPDAKDKSAQGMGQIGAATAEGKVHVVATTDDPGDGPDGHYVERWSADVDTVVYEAKDRLIRASNRDGSTFTGAMVRTHMPPAGSTDQPEAINATLVTNVLEVLLDRPAEAKPGA